MRHLKKIQSVSEIIPKDYMVIYSTEENVFCKAAEPTPQYEFVDLGLPSGLKWAKCNIGAESETDYGLYFQWGDTVGYEGNEAKAHSSWATAPFNNGASNYDATYFASVRDQVIDSNNVLLAENDAAHVHMGGDWRTPTSGEVQELISNTTSAWTQENGVNGMRFTSKKDSTKSIFVPANGNFHNGSHSNAGSYGYYWPSRLNSSNPDCANFLSFFNSYVYVSYCDRNFGFSVRAVHP